MKIKKNENNKNGQLFELFKLISSIILLILIVLQIESFFYFLLKIIFKNIILLILFLLIFHYLFFHYIIESFLFLIQIPFFGKQSYKSNGGVLAKELITYLSLFIDICEKIVDNEKIDLSQEYINLLDIYEKFNILIYIFYEMKKRYGLSAHQKKFYDSLVTWRKHFNQFKVLQFFQENKKFINSNTNILFNKNLLILIQDTNIIIKICEDYICDNYHFLSFKKILYYINNDTFHSDNQYKTEFSLKFKEQYNSFITKDNKEIDYVIIEGKRIIDLFSARTKFQGNSENKNENNDNNNNIINTKEENNLSILTNNSKNSDINDESDYSSFITYSNYLQEKTKNKNLIIYCNPNSMTYQFFSPEKFYFYFEGGCDILLWNYRGYGQSDGFSTFENVKNDILELFDEIQKLNKYDKIGVHGYSIGGIPAIHLAKNRNIDLLISDRNFVNFGEIAKMYSLGGLLKFFCKFFWIERFDNINNYLFTKNPDCIKVILCDPLDEVVLNNGSLKSGISRYVLSKFNKKENALDIFLDSYEKYAFTNSLINIEEFIEKNNSFNDNLFMIYLSRFFDCFSFGTEDLINYKQYDKNKLKIFCIDNFFNNFFVWGTRLNVENKEKNIFYDTNNNLNYIEKAIDNLELLQSMKSNLEELIDDEDILKHIKMVKDGFIRMKNNIDDIKLNDDLNKGYFIRLKCGHNVILKGNDEKILVKILEKENFIS